MKQQTQKNKIEWKEVELSEVAEVIRGMSYNSQDVKEKSFDECIPVLRAGNIQESKVIYEDFVYILKKLVGHSQILKKGDIIIATSSGSKDIVGKAARINKDFSATFGAFCCAVRIKAGNSNFLKFYFQSKHYKRFVENSLRGININNLKISEIRTLKIPFPFSNGKPDLKEQKRIVSILEKAEKLKEKSKNARDFLDEYLKSVFNEMFYNQGFEEVKIEDGILKTNTKNPITDFPDKYFNYIDIASVDNTSKKIVETKKMLGKDAPSRAKQLVHYNDLLISTVRPNLNAVSLVPKNLDNQICSTGFCILRADNKNFTPEYLFYTSKTNSFVNSLVKKCKGANYPAVSNNDVKSIKITLPPLPLQQKFASIVEKVERMKENINKTKKNAEELFNALMSKAFRGEL